MQRAVARLSKTPPDPALLAENLAASARSNDPFEIARHLGVAVKCVVPAATMNAPGALRPGAILVSTATPEDGYSRVVAEMLARVAIKEFLLPVIAPERAVFARAFADALERVVVDLAPSHSRLAVVSRR